MMSREILKDRVFMINVTLRVRHLGFS